MNITTDKIKRALTDPGYASLVVRGRYHEVRQWMRRREGIAEPPRTLVVFLTDLCNLRCKFCGQWGDNGVNIGKPTLQMAFGTFETLMRQVAPYKPYIILMGGEPLVNREWPAMLRLVKSLGMDAMMITNGTLIDEKVAAQMVELGLNGIAVSIDGTEATHDAIRGPGNYRRVMAGVNRLFMAREAAGVAFPEVTLSATICEKNYAHLVEAAESLRDVPITRFNVQHLFWITETQMSAHNNGFQAAFGLEALNMEGLVQEPGNLDVDVMLEELRILREGQYPFAVSAWPDYPEDVVREYYTRGDDYVRRTPKACEFIWKAVAVYPDGQLTPCMNFPGGKIGETDFNEIWNGPEYRRFRRWILKSGYLPVCQRCCN